MDRINFIIYIIGDYRIMVNFTALLDIFGIYKVGNGYNFKNEVNGETEPTGWNNQDDGDGESKISPIIGLHKKVIWLEVNAGQPIMEHLFTNQDYGTIEYLIRCVDGSMGSDEAALILKGTGANNITIIFIDSNTFWRFDGDGVVNIGHAAPDNIWIHIRIDFECTVGGYQGLAQWKYKIFFDENEYGDYSFKNNVTPNEIVLTTTASDCYFDAFGFTWEDYTIGDNLSLEQENITANIIRGKISEELYTISFGEITIKGDIFTYEPGSIIRFYDVNSVLSWKGIILAPELTAKGEGSNDYVSVIQLVGISSYYDAIYRKNYTTVRDSDYILKDIIDTFLTKFHSYGTLIDNFTITYKYDLKKPILKMMYYLAMLERAVLHYLPGGEIFFNKYDNLKSINEGYYQGSGGFNYQAVGDKASLNEIDWVDSHILYNGEAVIREISFDHKNILRLLSDITPGEDPEVTHNLPAAVTSGIWEFYWGGSDASERKHVQFQDGGETVIFLRQDGDSFLYIDEFDAPQNIAAAADNTLYRHKIVLRADDTFDWYINDALEVDNENVNNILTGGVDTIRLHFPEDSVSFMYFDAPGMVGETDPRGIVYVEGDNLGFTILQHRISKRLSITKYVPAANRYITRAPVIGAYNSAGQVYVVGVAATQVADELQFGIRELQAWRDSEITNYTEANQLATNLQAVYNLDTQFITLLTQGYGHFQVGYTMYLKSSIVFEITGQEFLIIRRIWYPTTDLCELVVTDNILPEAQFNKRIIQKIYDIEAQQSYEDSDMSEVGADGIVTPLVSLAFLRSIIGLTNAGHAGIGNYMINKTGAASVKGTILDAHTDDFSCKIADASSNHVIGIMYPDGVADGEKVLVIKGLAADVLLKNATASTAGNWAKTSNVAGRADMTGASPAAAPTHFLEIGHCEETKGAETPGLLAEIDVHFN